MDPSKLTVDFLNSINSDDFAPLFNTNNNVVSVIKKGRNKTYNVLERSKEIDAVIARAVSVVRESHCRNSDDVRGVLYMLFRFKEDGDPSSSKIPLYLGKTSRYGKVKALNSLFNSLNSKPRWDYSKDGNYHLSGLSSMVCFGYEDKDKNTGKMSWAKSMFLEFPSHTPTLNYKPYLWFRPWTTSDVSIVKELGHVSLHLEELILIDILSKAFPEDLLNKADTDKSIL